MDDLIRRQDAIELIENESRKWGDEYGISDVLCDLADMPSAQPEQRWIPVSERLPKVDNISKRVLVTTSWGVVKEAYYCVDHWSIDDVDYKFSVAAWMPLPEPWKGEEE